MARSAPKYRRGESPRFHTNRIPLLVRHLAETGRLRQHQIRAAIARHCEAVGAPVPVNGHAVETEAAVVAALCVLGGQIDCKSPNAPLSEQINSVLTPPMRGRTGPTQIVTRLVAGGYITVQYHKGNRRIDRATVTRKGHAWVGNHVTLDEPDVWAYGYEPGGKFRPAPVHIPGAEVPIPAMPAGRMSLSEAIASMAAPPEPSPADDLLKLQRLCLHLADQRDALEGEVQTQQNNIDTLVEVVARLEAELQRVRALVPETVMARGDGCLDTTIAARLRDDERAALDRLMREVPQS